MRKYILFLAIVEFAPLYSAYFYDLNKDGYLDMVLGYPHAGYARIYWGVANGFDNQNYITLNIPVRKSSIEDLDKDGYYDIIFSGRDSYSYIVWGKDLVLNDSLVMTLLPSDDGDGNAVVDLNGDGYYELIFTGVYRDCAHIYWGSPVGYSSARMTQLPYYHPLDVAVGDLNNDGKLDIALIGAHYYAYIYYAQGTDSIFYDQSHMDSLPTSISYGIEIADVNKDGYADVICAGHRVDWEYHTYAYIYYGSANGFDWTNRTALPTIGGHDVGVFDVNKDGYLDIIVPNGFNNNGTVAGYSYIYWGSTSGYDSTNRQELYTIAGRDVMIADFNSDGYSDLVITNESNSPNYYFYLYWGAAEGYSDDTRDSLYGPYTCGTEDNEIAQPSVSNLLRVRSVYGTPGCEVTLPVEMRNSQSVGGVQFVIKFDKNFLTLTPVPVNLGEYASNMELMYNIWDDSVKVCIYSTSGEVIESGEGVLAEVNFDINSSAQYGDSTFIDLMDVVVSDANANELTFEVEDGWIYFAEGMKGDVNKDGKVDILDVVRTINIILGIGEEPTEYELWAADVVPPPHGDGEVNVLDVVGIIAMILHEEIDLSTNEVTATVELGNPVGTGSELTVPVKLTNSGEIRGLQFTFVYDPDAVEIKDVLPKDRCTNFKVSYNTNDNKLTVLVYDEDGAVLNSGSGEILEIPVAIKGDLNGNPPLALESCVLATQDAREVNTTLLQKPTIVILGYPNPVKDNLMIDCYASGNLKKLAVYDMLGRMVRTLEPVKISHGLYRAEWDTKDNTGRKVRTGHYFIRGVMDDYEGVSKVTVVK